MVHVHSLIYQPLSSENLLVCNMCEVVVKMCAECNGLLISIDLHLYLSSCILPFGLCRNGQMAHTFLLLSRLTLVSPVSRSYTC